LERPKTKLAAPANSNDYDTERDRIGSSLFCHEKKKRRRGCHRTNHGEVRHPQTRPIALEKTRAERNEFTRLRTGTTSMTMWKVPAPPGPKKRKSS